MLCLEPSVVDAVWSAISSELGEPGQVIDGPGRPRVPDRDCFTGLLTKLVTGVSWETLGQLQPVSAGTLKRRRRAWVQAGIFDSLFTQAIAGYNKLIGLNLSAVLVDGSTQKAPRGGEGTGRNPTDKGKRGYKWSLATDAAGVPVGFVTDGANVPDYQLLEPTLDVVASYGLLDQGVKVCCDRGYDYPLVHTLLTERNLANRVRRKRKPGAPPPVQPQLLGRRWPVERTNAWLTNFGQLRRATDRRLVDRDAWMALAVVLILVTKLVNAKQLRTQF